MVESQTIPIEHHVARYCSGSLHQYGKVLPAAFELRDGESYLSVNWLEYFGLETFDGALSRICTDKHGLGFNIRKTGRFAVLNVGIVRSLTENLGDQSETIYPLTVTHMPEAKDKSHSGIGGYPDGILYFLVRDMLSEKVSADMLMTPNIPQVL